LQVTLDGADRMASFIAAVETAIASALGIDVAWVHVTIVSGRRLFLESSAGVRASYTVEIPKTPASNVTVPGLIKHIDELNSTTGKSVFVGALNTALDGSGMAALDASTITVSHPVEVASAAAIPASSVVTPGGSVSALKFVANPEIKVVAGGADRVGVALALLLAFSTTLI